MSDFYQGGQRVVMLPAIDGSSCVCVGSLYDYMLFKDFGEADRFCRTVRHDVVPVNSLSGQVIRASVMQRLMRDYGK